VTGEAIEVAFAVPVESLASQIETHDVITLESLDAEDLARHFHLLASLSKFFNCSIRIERPSLDNVISGASKELIIVGPAKIVSAHLVASLKVFDKIARLSIKDGDALICRASRELRTIRRWLHLSDVTSVGVSDFHSLTFENWAFVLQEFIRLASREESFLLTKEATKQSVEDTTDWSD
jgi:hypothetical protein